MNTKSEILIISASTYLHSGIYTVYYTVIRGRRGDVDERGMAPVGTLRTDNLPVPSDIGYIYTYFLFVTDQLDCN